jgi:hypothetical protein
MRTSNKEKQRGINEINEVQSERRMKKKIEIQYFCPRASCSPLHTNSFNITLLLMKAKKKLLFFNNNLSRSVLLLIFLSDCECIFNT